jgi:hypothetical protein
MTKFYANMSQPGCNEPGTAFHRFTAGVDLPTGD